MAPPSPHESLPDFGETPSPSQEVALPPQPAAALILVALVLPLQEAALAAVRGADDEAKAELRQQRAHDFRPRGPPACQLIEQRGELFLHVIVDWDAADAELVRLVLARQMFVRRHRVATRVMTWDQARDVLKDFKEEWRKRPHNLADEREVWQRTWTQEAFRRTVDSNFRTYCWKTFGGRCWMLWYFVLGELPEELVVLANEHYADVIAATEARAPRETPHPEPRRSAGAPAAARGEPYQRTGVLHERTDPYRARKEARWYDREIQEATREWEAGRSQMSRRAWESLLQRREVDGGVGVRERQLCMAVDGSTRPLRRHPCTLR